MALLGTITASLSFILASFSIDSFVGLIILHGFMYGIGGSFAYLVRVPRECSRHDQSSNALISVRWLSRRLASGSYVAEDL